MACLKAEWSICIRVDCTNRYTNIYQKYITKSKSMSNTQTYATGMQSPTVNGIEIFPFNCTEPFLTLFNIVFATRDRVRFISFVASIGIINTQHKTELFVIELHVNSSFLLRSWNKNGGERPTSPYLPNNHAECRVHYVSQLSRYRALSRTTHL